mgnify:CR=1 FL=1
MNINIDKIEKTLLKEVERIYDKKYCLVIEKLSLNRLDTDKPDSKHYSVDIIGHFNEPDTYLKTGELLAEHKKNVCTTFKITVDKKYLNKYDYIKGMLNQYISACTTKQKKEK